MFSILSEKEYQRFILDIPQVSLVLAWNISRSAKGSSIIWFMMVQNQQAQVSNSIAKIFVKIDNF